MTLESLKDYLSLRAISIIFFVLMLFSAAGLRLNLGLIPREYLTISLLAFLSLAALTAGLSAIEQFAKNNPAGHVAEYVRGLVISIMAGFVTLVLSELKGADVLSWTYWFQLGPVVLVSAFFIVVGGYVYTWSYELEEESEDAN